MLKSILSILYVSTCTLTPTVVVSGYTISVSPGSDLVEPNVIDLTNDGSSTVLRVRLCDYQLKNSTFNFVSMTRYCYCYTENNVETCSIPGPTLLMQNNTNNNLTIINALKGSNIVYTPNNATKWNKYKDIDTTNVHVHGLHVSPFIDDILIKIKPNNHIHNYSYSFGFHYPGTFWYHAHHHGSTTFQVNLGLHGAILMQNSGDKVEGRYDENVLIFNYIYAIPATLCLNDSQQCPNASNRFAVTNINLNYINETLYDLTDEYESSLLNAIKAGNLNDYSMCDTYCSFPKTQTNYNVTDYRYDVTTDISVNNTALKLGLVDENLLLFLVNGLLEPIIQNVSVNAYRRLRMVNALSSFYIQFKFPSECDWHLIATDGTYIGGTFMNYDLSATSHNYQLLLAPGGRNDVLFRCSEIGTYQVVATKDNSQDSTGSLRNFQRVSEGTVLFKINVTSRSSSSSQQSLPTSYIPKPTGSYIQDLTPLTSKNSTFETECLCNWNNETTNQASSSLNECYFGFKINTSLTGNEQYLVNNKTFKYVTKHKYPFQADSLSLLLKNKAYQFTINNDENGASLPIPHVYHQHINPFQVQKNVSDNGFIALYSTWWDTLGNLPLNSLYYLDIRFWTRDYHGLVIIHCHILEHEDSGMMGFYNILNDTITSIDPDSCPNQYYIIEQTTDDGETEDDAAIMYMTHSASISKVAFACLIMFLYVL